MFYSNKDSESSIKNNACNHIRCNRWNMNYCSIFGILEENVEKDKNSIELPIFQHNNWKTDKNRCPIFIKDFNQMIHLWPQRELDATVEFEKYKTFSFMKKVIEKHTFSKVKKVHENFCSKTLSRLRKDLFDNEDYYKTFKHYDIIDQKIFNFNKI